MKKSIVKRIICLPIILIVVVATIIGNVVANYFANEINSLLCPPMTDNSALEAASAEGQALSREIIKEGTVLVKNEDNVLPLDRVENRKVNVFGHSNVDWGYGISGSGRVRPENDDFSTTYNLIKALDTYGIKYNTELIDMYKKFRSISRQEEAADNGFYALYEPAVTDKAYYSDALLANAKEYSNTAIVTITRFGAEGVDYPWDHLQISEEERGLLEYVGANYEKVIVVINSGAVINLSFLDTIPGLDACIVVGLTGTQAAAAIPSVLYGEVSPSGRLADTYPYDFKSNISYNYYHQAAGNATWTRGKDAFYDYIEGIYVGYKWYETADAEGYWNSVTNEFGTGYDAVVQFPFGYGLSYTNFEWTVEDVIVKEGETVVPDNKITDKSDITIQLKVENVGDVTGKDVVEVYLTAPYTDGGIEKAHVNLVQIEKTIALEPFTSQTLEIKLSAYDFTSYDCYDRDNNGFYGYELEKGTYAVKLMTDSHNLKADCAQNTVNFEVANTINVEKDKYTGATVTNRLTGATSMDGASVDGNDDGNTLVNYVKRSEFPALSSMTTPAYRDPTAKQAAAGLYTKQEAEAWDNATTDNFGNPVENKHVAWSKSGNLSVTNADGTVSELGYELGADYNSEKWEALLDQVTIDEAVYLISYGYAANAEVKSIGKPKLSDYDNSVQIKGFTGAPRGTGFPGEPVLAQTFNKQLARQYGMNFGKEMDALGVGGVYGFGANIHRSPFCGRNSEYYSEDAYLSGIILTNCVIGLQNAGKYAMMNHFVLNESETGRTGAYTWCTEQALREIYARPFQMAIEQGDAMAMMTAYNRVGANYSGGSQGLINGIVRYEWGFKGGIITDCSSRDDFMNMDEALRAGGDLGMSTELNSPQSTNYGSPLNYSATSSNRLQYQMREAVHHVTYMYLHAQYQNKTYNENSAPEDAIISSSAIESWAWWRVVIVDLDIMIGLGAAIWIYFLFRDKSFFDGKKKSGSKTQDKK